MTGAEIAVGALIVSAAAGAGETVYTQNKEADARKKQRKLQQLQQAKETRQQVAQSRIAAAEIQNQGANTGTTASSGVQGGVGAVSSQMASNIGYLSQTGDIQSKISSDMGDIQTAQGVGGLVQGVAGAVGSYGMMSSQASAKNKQAKNIFESSNIFS